MANIENIANSAQSWVTYDITQGKWSMVINQAGTSSHSFDDSNIVGEVDLVTTQLDRLYNAVEVQYPDNDIEDSNSFVRAEMLPGDLLQNEPENVLRLTYPLLSDQIQALHLGLTELKQSRLDKVITFVSDYTSYGIRAGDVIDVTVDTYNWTNKLFRVLQLEEVDRSDGYIDIRITAIEYDDSIYDHDLTRYTLSNEDGIFGLGDIGAMDPITLTLTEVDQLPNILIESAFNPIGAPVTGVEIWTYPVTDPTEIANWNNPALYPDEERNYKLLTTKFSVDETFDLGADFDHTIYDLGPNNWLIKIRPINAQTKGPFTTPGGLTIYDPNIANGIASDLTQVTGFDDTMFLIQRNGFYFGPGYWTGQSQQAPLVARYGTGVVFLDFSANFDTSGSTASATGYLTIQLLINGVPAIDSNGLSSFIVYVSAESGSVSFKSYYVTPVNAGDTIAVNVSANTSWPVNFILGETALSTAAVFSTI